MGSSMRSTQPTPAAPLLALVLFSLGQGCAGVVHSVKPRPPPPLELSAAEAGTQTATIGRWWQDFSDPGLNQLVERGLRDNLDRKRAHANLLVLRAASQGAKAGRWPTVGLNAGVSRSRSSVVGMTRENTSYEASVAASYELDLFGRIGFGARQAELTAEAAALDVQTHAISLAAQVTELWFQLVEARASEDLTRKQLTVNQTYLKLVELRFYEGQVSALDVYQQRGQVSTLRAQLPVIGRTQRLLEHQLAEALGVPPGALTLPAARALPALPELPPQGLPARLIQQRPDLKAAQARVEAADNAVGAAIAARFPTISLSASVGSQAFEARDLFDNWLYNLAANLALPIIDGGRRRAEVDRQRAAMTAQLMAYGQTALTGLREVQDALAKAAAERQILAELDARMALAERTLSEARSRYLNGLVDYLVVLSALRSKEQLEQEQLAAQRRRLSCRVSLYRAIGGGWAAELDPPTLPDPEQDEQAEGAATEDPSPASAAEAEAAGRGAAAAADGAQER